jgi:hypothetical protein
MYTGHNELAYSVDYPFPELETVHSNLVLEICNSTTQQPASRYW